MGMYDYMKKSFFSTEANQSQKPKKEKSVKNKEIKENTTLRAFNPDKDKYEFEPAVVQEYMPTSFDDIKLLTEKLTQKEPIIVDMSALRKDEAQRMLDFLSGAVFVLDASLHEIRHMCYLLTPQGVNILVGE